MTTRALTLTEAAEYRVLVCGGRHYSDSRHLGRVLGALATRPTLIIHGDATGADELAQRWARRQRIPDRPFPADWGAHGRAAGPIRNQQMLDEGQPHLVVAFPGGAGTADMVRRAEAAGVTVLKVI